MTSELRATGLERTGKGKEARSSYAGLVFLTFVLLLYLLLVLVKPERAEQALRASGSILLQIAPVLLVVVGVMGLLNFVISPGQVSKYVGKGSGLKGWVLVISTGLMSYGPIYLWYPLLGDLQAQGMRSGLIAAFLYNRAIKLPYLLLMVYYFGLAFVLVLLIYMILASVIEGVVIELVES
jgi:uncharacterized membrane protein YraQ (UPF0718 family)